MTARVTLACDGIIPGGGYPCRQATPTGTPTSGSQARTVANRLHGWRVAIPVDPAPRSERGRLLDLCPPCARRAAEHPETGLQLLPVAVQAHTR